MYTYSIRHIILSDRSMHTALLAAVIPEPIVIEPALGIFPLPRESDRAEACFWRRSERRRVGATERDWLCSIGERLDLTTGQDAPE